MPILILDPDPAWPGQFQRLKAALLPALPRQALIHHIGSTAVPGLAAKDIIDIQITLPALTDLDPSALVAAGLTRRRPSADQCPPGMTLPQADLAKRLYGCTSPRPANVHVREAGRFNQRYPLLCRDYLRTHPLAAAAYSAVKQNLAARFPDDVDAYYAVKDPVFDLIRSAAEPWALATGWTPPLPD